MKKEIPIIVVLIILATSISGLGYLFFNRNRPTPIKPSDQDKFCDWIRIEAVKTQFCLDKRLIKDYETQTFDWRNKKIKDTMWVGVEIKTKDYKESQELDPGMLPGMNWINFKVISGIKLSFIADTSPRIKTFDELKSMYLKTYYEEHNEFPPHKNWEKGSTYNLDYVYSVKINDPESLSKGLEIEAHFLKNGIKYKLFVMAATKSISEEDFQLIYNTILNTIHFQIE